MKRMRVTHYQIVTDAKETTAEAVAEFMLMLKTISGDFLYWRSIPFMCQTPSGVQVKARVLRCEAELEGMQKIHNGNCKMDVSFFLKRDVMPAGIFEREVDSGC